ncbi:MAG: mandelate racemase/muconate lactonizing enzyme family protein [Aestuariivita sp.]|nr:mandelate racemase/muconate lactonizing enzyme family protein [Aestuariivita sp.]MCY4203804.1 mandelate racemase/muconate lactonizing enzyme family protein [Aestuariivita sp.]MCY4288419.1 mandelate racemase/muconate lactonizing enzyme family protein [Aestuariivita sp.]MCY4345894.1 mandelate racemase/muconate lactonizing enzyme family protein [Aestuariivita sp.]
MNVTDASQFDLSVNLSRVEIVLVRAEISAPVRTSFGIMYDRPTLLLRVTDRSGVMGYGEIWCNFPVCGAAHRLKLVETELAPRITAAAFCTPHASYSAMSSQLHVLRLQSGEAGPIAQVIAGLDIAVWDMVARRAGVPVYVLLSAKRTVIPVYASAINPIGVLDAVNEARTRGHRNFKVKIGFGYKTDYENIKIIASNLRDDERFMLDANQAWSPDEAKAAMQWITPFGPNWVEEPMPVDIPPEIWMQLKESTTVPIAGAENFITHGEYDQVIAEKWLDVVQPDIAKWGGFSECLPVAHAVVNAGLTFCPHSLGGGVALAASAHLLAAAGGPGLLECDVNENRLRDAVFSPPVKNGVMTLTAGPGLGVNTELLNEQFD